MEIVILILAEIKCTFQYIQERHLYLAQDARMIIKATEFD